MSSVDRIELYEYLLNINTSSKIYQGCIYDIDILKDYAECKTRSKELTSCDLFKYKSYTFNKGERKSDKFSELNEDTLNEMKKKKIPKSFTPFTSELPWDVSSTCMETCLNNGIMSKKNWIYEEFPNIFALIDLLMIFIYQLDEKKIRIESDNLGQRITADGQRNNGIIELFNVIMKESSINYEFDKIINFHHNIYFNNKKTKYFSIDGEEINKISSLHKSKDYSRIESKIFSKSSNIIIVSDIKGNISSLMRILFRLYLSKVIGQNLKILVNNMFIVFTGDWFGEIDSIGGYLVFRVLCRLMFENMEQVIVTRIPNKLDKPKMILEKIEKFKINMGIFENLDNHNVDEEEEEEENIDIDGKDYFNSNSKYVNDICLINSFLPKALLVKKENDLKWVWVGNHVDVPISMINSEIKNAIFSRNEYDNDDNNEDEDDNQEREYIESRPYESNYNMVRYYVSSSSNSNDINPEEIQNNYIVMGQKVETSKVMSRSDEIKAAPVSNLVGGGSNNKHLRYKISKFSNLKTIQRCSRNICSGHTYEINIPEDELVKKEYIGLEASTFMRRKDSFLCLRMNISSLETSFIHIIPEIIEIDEDNYLQKMRNGKIYIEKQLLKKYIRSIREIIDIKVPRNKILEVLKKNGYNPNRALVELANYRVSYEVSNERLPKDKSIMIEPSAFRIPKKEDISVSYSKFDIPINSKADLNTRDLSIIIFHAKRANAIKKKGMVSLRSPSIFRIDNDSIFLREYKDEEPEEDEEEFRYLHGIYRINNKEYHGLFKYKEEEYHFVTGIEFLSPKSNLIESIQKNHKYTILSFYYFGTKLGVNSIKIRPDNLDTIDLNAINLQIGSNVEINFKVGDKMENEEIKNLIN